MITKLPKPLLFVIAFSVAAALYWPLLNGTPIWDDLTYWFQDPVMINDFSYLDFWKRFTWPMSNTVQKFLLGIFDKNYFAYHIIALLLHFANSFLVYLMAKKLKYTSPFWLFLFFLLSPVCVISVGWLIQIKTLLAFFFGISAFIAFLNFFENRKWIYAAWFLFLLSIAAKSTLITLPVIMLLMCYKKLTKVQYLFILPFFIISGVGAYRILTSPITQSALDSLLIRTSEEKDPVAVSGIRITQENSGVVQRVDESFVVMSLYYYFWHVVVPFDNAPVKGPNFEDPEWAEMVHLFFLLTLVGIFWRERIALYLIAGHILLFPFVGIIPAPFMIVTWVSDQHLYAILPAFLAFWIYVVQKIKSRHNWILLALVLVCFSFKTHQASQFYKNEFTFYQESLHSNPTNLPIAYNLAFAYLRTGQIQKSLQVLEDTYALSQYYPEMKKRRYYNYLMLLYISLKFPDVTPAP